MAAIDRMRLTQVNVLALPCRASYQGRTAAPHVVPPDDGLLTTRQPAVGPSVVTVNSPHRPFGTDPTGQEQPP